MTNDIMLKFSDVANVFSEIESRSGRLEMTDILAELFKRADKSEISRLVYLIQGILAPPYEGIDLGLGEQFAIRAIAASAGYSREQVEANYKKSGDLGLTAEELLKKKRQQALSSTEMDVIYVHTAFVKMAKTGGTGSQELKIKYLTELLNNSEPLGGRFIVRFVTGQLRLGVGDPTILDALSVSRTGDKSLREELERAYSVCADMGHVATVFFENPDKIRKFSVQPFKPLMPALAERLSTPEEIIEKIPICSVEMKFDGFRLQVHKKGNNVELYSRKLEKMTPMFPEIVSAVTELACDSIIFEGEALAYEETGTGKLKKKKYLSFQETIQRKRKHGISDAAKAFPLNLFAFDILYLDGKDLTTEPYEKRRKILEKIFPSGKNLKLSERKIVKSGNALEKLFRTSMDSGLEGIMAKDPNSPYAAGKRKFAWIKLKKSYGKAVDTIDVVIVGYYLGKGARAEFEFGGLLAAVQNTKSGKLETVAKIGSGFSEDEMRQFKEMLEKIQTKSPPKDLEFNDAQKPDYWVVPKYVAEVAFDEITKSPTHTCGMKANIGGETKGHALRFPRLLALREDKSVKEITTSEEVESLYYKQHR
ncbi:TPA: ATP-dependent DNA ligase [Candidatus Micrarchaeota archaeon]|nr:ATP-dependent DNA ligase [Candidatus Micrarchaeota archaeon]